MAKSIKYKEADTYHDAANVYDFTQEKTQEELNNGYEAAQIKSMKFTATVDQYSSIRINVPGRILFVNNLGYLVIVQNVETKVCRVFGPLNTAQLNKIPQGTVIEGTVYYCNS